MGGFTQLPVFPSLIMLYFRFPQLCHNCEESSQAETFHVQSFSTYTAQIFISLHPARSLYSTMN